MPRASSEHALTLDEENLMSLWICFLQRTEIAVEMVVKKKYCLFRFSSYQLAVLSRRVRYALTTSGVAGE